MPTEVKSYKGLLNKRAALVAESKALLATAEKEERGLTDEERAKYDALASNIEAISETVARLERQQELEASLTPRETDTGFGGPADDEPEDQPQAWRTTSVTLRNRTPSGGPYANFGEQLRDMKAVVVNKDGPAHERLLSVAEYHKSIRADAQGMGTAVDSDGGYLVQKDFSTAILTKMHDTGQLMSRVAPYPIGPQFDGTKLPMVDETSRVDGSRWGGIRGYWVEEGEVPTSSKPKFAELGLEVHDLAVLCYLSDRQLEDAPLAETIAMRGFSEELTFKVENAIFRGTGAGQPQGFMEAAALISIAKETGQAADTITHDNLKKMWARLHVRSRANAIWLINQDCEPTLDDLAKIIGTSGVEPNYVTYGPDGVLRIKGRPVIVTEYNASVGDLGDIVLIDLSQYALATKGGIQQASSIHVAFTTFETAFRAKMRVDGGLLWKSALTPFKGSNTVSPAIALAAR